MSVCFILKIFSDEKKWSETIKGVERTKGEQVRERVKWFRERKREEKLQELRGNPDENEESTFSNCGEEMNSG